MSQFKVGDTVRCTAAIETLWGFMPNHLYRVKAVNTDNLGLSSLDGGYPTAEAVSACWHENSCYFAVANGLDEGVIDIYTGRRGVKAYESN